MMLARTRVHGRQKPAWLENSAAAADIDEILGLLDKSLRKELLCQTG